MILKNLFEDYHSFDNQKILMFYKGAVSQETMVDLGSFLRSSLCGSKKIRSIFSVFIEMSHNIRHHSLERDQNHVGVGLFMIQQTEEFFTLSSGNPILSAGKEEIRREVEMLRTLDKEGLRKLYLQRRKTGELTNKGAGLGLIEMARKSDTPIECEFFDCDDKTTLFRLTVQVAKGD